MFGFSGFYACCKPNLRLESLWQLFMLLPLLTIANTTINSELPPVPPTDIHFRLRMWFWNVEEYPHPQKMPRSCNRYQKSFVCDPDKVLSIEEANALDVIIQAARNDTSCLCSICNSTTEGVTIGVAIVKNIFLHFHTAPSEEIRVFAETLRQNWNLGNCDDDILILISTNDKMRYTDMGSAVASLLKKEIEMRIFLKNRSHFTAGHYYQGLESMIQSYADAIRMEEMKRASASRKQASINLIVGLTVIFIILVVFLAGLAFWWTKRKQGRENNRRYSWEMSNSLKRGDIVKVQVPFMSVRTSDNQAPAIAEKQREGYLERLNEEEELELEQLHEEKHHSEEYSEDETVDIEVKVDIEGESKSQQTKDCSKQRTQKSDDESEEYFMPQKRSETQWQVAPTSGTDDVESINL